MVFMWYLVKQKVSPVWMPLLSLRRRCCFEDLGGCEQSSRMFTTSPPGTYPPRQGLT